MKIRKARRSIQYKVEQCFLDVRRKVEPFMALTHRLHNQEPPARCIIKQETNNYREYIPKKVGR